MKENRAVINFVTERQSKRLMEMNMVWRRRLFSGRAMIFLSVFLVLSSVSSNFVSAPAVKANRWATTSGAIAVTVNNTPAATSPELESLGYPLSSVGYGFPQVNMWPDSNLMYLEAAYSHTSGEYQWGRQGPFVVYDVSSRQVIYSGNTDIHTVMDNIMVDNQGNAYFSVNDNGLAKYSSSTNSVSVLPVTFPSGGALSASTRQASDGWIYGATSSPYKIFRFNPSTNTIEEIADAWGYTFSMTLDPTDRYIYLNSNIHGGNWYQGAPILQFDTQTKNFKVIAFLNQFYEDQYGYRLGGSYNIRVDDTGKRLFVGMNAQELGVDTVSGFGSPVFFTIHIPQTETQYASVPRFSFKDVTQDVGIDGDAQAPLYNSYLHTASWGDVDNDGWPDLFVGSFYEAPSLVTNKLLLNKNGTFVDSHQSSVEIAGSASGSVFADFDNDGDLDLFISNSRRTYGSGATAEPSHILRNDDGVFIDVSSVNPVLSEMYNGRQAGVLDYNNDGLIDIFVVADCLVGCGNSILLKNTGNLEFVDATSDSGIPTDLHGLGLAIGDVTGNGWPDIFIAGGPSQGNLLQDNRNYMFIAEGDGTYHLLQDNVFDWLPYTNLVGREDWTSGGAFGDVNRDGRLDLVISHHFGSSAELSDGEPIRLYLNQGLDSNSDPIFEDVTSQVGLPKIDSKSPHAEIQDFDNDGWPDIYTSVSIDTPQGPMPLIFKHDGNAQNLSFSYAYNITSIQNPHYVVAGPVADFNRDGKLDIFMGEWRSVLGTPAPSMLWQNNGAPGNWLQVQVDDGTNRLGIGAKIKIYKAGMIGQVDGLLGFKEIYPGYGYSSSQPAIAHFGLGDETHVDVEVTMPFGGIVYQAYSVPANRAITMPNPVVERPAHEGLEYVAETDTSDLFIQDRSDLPSHTVASTAPTVDFAVYPHPDYQGDPWSQWGTGVLASNGRSYTAIGDHMGRDGNSFVYEYDPITKKLKCIGDIHTASNHTPGQWGHGKIHGTICEGKDGYIYMASYWGARTDDFSGEYKGDLILRYPLNTAASSSATLPDTTPPTVSISSPANNATVSGTITVSASASDDVGVAGVQFKLDGNNLGAEDTTSPYSISWDTTTATNGAHSLTAVARDTVGNQATSSAITVTVTVNDEPGEVTNVALGKTAITISSETYGTIPSILTDGITTTTPYLDLEVGLQWIELDLEALFNISRVNVRHYYGDGRTYQDVILQLSEDGINWVTIFNNDADNSAGQGVGIDGEYAETSGGKEVLLDLPIQARYVRCWSNGSTANEWNHYVELEAFGVASGANQPPSVDAGTDATITLPADAFLDGTVSDDGLPSDTLTITWSKVSGPGIVTFVDSLAVDTTATFSEPGTYVLRLTASDGELSNQDDVTITVNPVYGCPVAEDQSITTDQDTPVSITLSASDLDGDPLTYDIVTSPSHGTLSGTPPAVTYTPNPGFFGLDSFTFTASDGAATSNTSTVTITVNQVVAVGGGGGSGGGSGGGGSNITSVIGDTTSDGKFRVDVGAKSADRKVVLSIPKDTIGLNSRGYRLTSISIEKRSSYPKLPEYDKLVSPVYYISPDGTTFEPAIELTISYDASLVPELFKEKNLVVATCGTGSNEWKILESAVSSENDTVKAKVNHFSYFAVLAPIHPASFTVTDLSITPGKVYSGEEVSITVLATNTGSLTGAHEVSLVVNDTIAENREVTLDGGDSELVTFSLTADTVGEYVVEVGELMSTFTVNEPLAPAEFITSNLDINPTEVVVGEEVTISVLVTNTGDLPRNYEASLLINGSVAQTNEIALNGGDIQEVSFQVTADTAGEFEVTIDNLSGIYKTIAKSEIISFDVNPVYQPDTGKLVLARVVYKMNKSCDMIEEELCLKVFRGGVFTEEIPLLKLSQIQPDGKTGEVGYMPSQGWQVGTYSFQAELYGTEGEGLIQVTRQEYVNVKPEAIAQVVSWKILGIFVGIAVTVTLAIVFLILYRNRHMLRGY